MRKIITLLTIGFLLFPAFGQGYERRVDSVRGRNGRMVRRYRFKFNDAPGYRAPRQHDRNYSAPGYEAPGNESRWRGGGYGPNYYPNYHPDYPGLDFSRYNMMPYFHADRMYQYNQRTRRGR